MKWYRLYKESMALEGRNNPTNATAYHITRNKFSKFKLSPTNSGMGTSFYGYGLYFACDKSTMDYYKEQMGKPYYIYEVTLDSTNFVDEWDEKHGLEYYGHLVEALGSEQAATKKMLKNGITGMTYFSPEDGNSIVIYTDKVVKDFRLIESSEPVNENRRHNNGNHNRRRF